MSELGSGRDAVANYISICHSIADSYPVSIAHGLQKDAIQNSVDARKGKKLPVHVVFQVIENEHGTFLTFTDSNTVGLTGDVMGSASGYRNLGSDDHWARFEAFAFTKNDPDALGARGQGKFIFLRASRQYKMVYDTLRDDGVYRLGATQATETGRQVYPHYGESWEDSTAKAKLFELCGLEPLREVGTRVIVCDPLPEVLEEIESDDFERAIQETWLCAIEKQQLNVQINTARGSKVIGMPSPYPLPDADTPDVKTWIYEKDFNDFEISSADGTFKIKKFHAACFREDSIQDDLQGIAIVQNGMKISSLNLGMAPPDIAGRITGFIEFDRELDRELRKGKNQHPNHYDLKWRGSTPRAIKQFINKQLNAFGRQKLGIGENEKEKQKRLQNSAEKEAMELFRRFAPDVDLRSPRPGPGPGPADPNPDPQPPPHKEIGLMVRTRFPDEGKKPRIDWGETISLLVQVFNKTADSVEGLLSARVLLGDSCIEVLLDNSRVALAPSENGPFVVKPDDASPIRVNIDASRYKVPGEYRIRLMLTDAESGSQLDVRTVRFWVEDNPPHRMPFNLEPAKLSTHRTWQAHDLDDDPTIYYNTSHPQYRYAQESEEMQADYLFTICLEGALHFILTRPHTDQGADYHPLNTDEIVKSSEDMMPEKVFEEISRYMSEVLWRRFEE